MLLRRDLLLGLILAIVANVALFGFDFHLQGNFDISLGDYFNRVRLGMSRGSMEELGARRNVQCVAGTGPGLCKFSDFRQDYYVYFSSDGHVKAKSTELRKHFRHGIE